ncbi:MAG: glycosyl transferase [Alphaproteobacteria bacterium 16-39-46]|nr:MAG: glycosyl transferase [Alphaproteobacteria bacterium 16-39-46]OZA43952.1 MAG: glycosyl transferase [Alphaproteobacteria bacterium 17-39-52]HQS83470.1 glycosyltransferase [Alphaproteobacteria bacterium]HQS93264.1 glycosyltransferase [Alphaproteobacteria bacterium]
MNRKQKIVSFIHKSLDWHTSKKRNKFFHEQDRYYHGFLVPKGLKILDLGSGNGDLLASLFPSLGVGIDLSADLVAYSKKKHPSLTFFEADVEENLSFLKDQVFDVVLLSDTIGFLNDIQNTLEALHRFCIPETRIIISYYSKYWEPILKAAEFLRLKKPTIAQNYLVTADIEHLLNLSGFDVIKKEYRQLIPQKFLGLGFFINKYIGTIPGLRRLCVRTYLVARPKPQKMTTLPSVSVIIPCRNERGNIEPALLRLPKFAKAMEIIFVEGHSKDKSWEEIKRVQKHHKEWTIKAYQQTGKGKGDAMRLGFEKASGDILMILDGDLTTPPEDMPKFYKALVQGDGEFINGTRLIYPMENQAMQFLNFLANKIFSWIFTYLLAQRFTDTLCGTKVLWARDYKKIIKNRTYFGDFDPFGDFDLIFGASKLNLKVVEIPVRYRARDYGSTQISRFTHGWLLLRMVLLAYRKFKAF